MIPKEAKVEVLHMRLRLNVIFDSRKIGALEAAINALEKQIPDRVLEQDPYNDKLFVVRCPSCKLLLGRYNKRLGAFSYSTKYKFCPECGQAIQWESENEND